MKKIIVALLITLPIFGIAQTMPQPPSPESLDSAVVYTEDPNQNSPEAYITSISVEKNIYKAGDTVRGSFEVSNAKAVPVTDMYFIPYLGGNFGTDLHPDSIYGIGNKGGPIYIGANGKQKVDFSYTLPNNIPSNSLGISIQTFFKDGKPAGRRGVTFYAEGPISPYINSITHVIVGNETFALLTGPIVKTGEIITFNASFKSDVDDVTITPNIKIFERLLTGRMLSSFSSAPLTIKSGVESKSVVKLPTFEGNDGVYTASIEYVDELGSVRSGPYEVRYIVGEPKLKIEAVHVEGQSIAKGEEVRVHVSYVEPPVDIRSNNAEDSRPDSRDNVSTNIELLNQSGDVIASGSQRFDPTLNTVSFYIPANTGANGYAVKVQLLENDFVIDTEEFIIEPETNEEPRSNVFDIRNYYNIGIGLVVLLLLITVLFIIKKSRHNKKGNDDMNNTMGGNNAANSIWVAILMIGGLFGMVNSVDASVQYHASGGSRSIYIPHSFTLNSPVPSPTKIYYQGEELNFNLDFWAGYCGNGPSSVQIWATNPRVNGSTAPGTWDYYKYLGGAGPIGGHADHNAFWRAGSFGPMYAPNESGTSYVWFYILNTVHWSIGSTHHNYYIGKVPITVDASDRCENIDGFQNTVPDGLVRDAAGNCSALEVSCKYTSPYINKGMTLEAITNGIETFIYSWTSNPVNTKINSATTKKVENVVYNSYGQKSATVSVRNQKGNSSASATCNYEIIDEPLSAKCVSPTATNKADYVWEGRGSGGSDTGYTCTWTKDGKVVSNNCSYTETFPKFGVYGTTLTVKDNKSGQTINKQCSVYYGSLNPDGTPISRASIERLDLDSPLTNDQCVVDFVARGSDYCDCIDINSNEAVRFYDDTITDPSIYPVNGEYDGKSYTVKEFKPDNIATYDRLGGAYAVNPSKYVIQCFNRDLVGTTGTPFQCLANPDFKEQ